MSDMPPARHTAPAPTRFAGFSVEADFGSGSVSNYFRRSGPQIVFLHIAKTAGTSISRYLNFAFPGSAVYHKTAEEFDQVDKSLLNAFDIVQGHISNIHLHKLRDDRFVFTFLRDPVDRVLSMYHFLREQSHPLDATNPSSPFVLAKQHDLLSFLQLMSPAVRVLVSNHQTYALGLDWRSRSRGLDRTILRRAKNTLKGMDFVGLTHRFDESVGLLFSELRLPDMVPGFWENKTSERRCADQLGKEEWDAIEDLNRLDIALYRYARRRYFLLLWRHFVARRMKKMLAAIRRLFAGADRDVAVLRQELFETLMAKLWVGNPYDVARVSTLPYDAQEDWGRDSQLLRTVVQRIRPQVIVEVGTWKGCSAMAMCDALRAVNADPTVICVDTWGGLQAWLEWLRDIKTDRGLPIIDAWQDGASAAGTSDLTWPGEIGNFLQFTSNVVSRAMDQNIVPMPIDGRFAASWFRQNHVKPDLVLLDASHDRGETLVLMNAYWDLLDRGAVMIGLDYHLTQPGVIEAVHEFSLARDVLISFQSNMWMACK
jgi:hypothetical protein